MRALLVPVAVLSSAGCVLTVDPSPPGGGGPDVAPANPTITYADAGCYPDSAYHDFVWYFEADVNDRFGQDDVGAVYADVYDTWNGEWVDGFDLYPDSGVTWYSAWVGGSTWLDCTYGGYEVDLTGVSVDGSFDVVTLVPATQW